ncbi:MAG TPA: ABC transporter permease [Chitinophaga sp.]|uniref:ABC transporter permease n=1 Tax=Chitinophaga sp. TaxID=1869181 RepID=UPI002C742B8E|nr:ABC transporter permease [Chitinophaga sp.]HVI46415.1 ABC transporter permease [Chitinophaga sp.]
MIKNYLKITWRQLRKDRLFTILNLTGLSTGLACALLVWLWVYNELSFDRFHEKTSQLYQVMEHQSHADGIKTTAETPALLAETLAAGMPEVVHAAASTPPSWFPKAAIMADNRRLKGAVLFAGKDYFNIFSYPLQQGNPQQVLADKNNVVISAALAEKLFHTTDAVGKTISWQIDHFNKTATVAGVFSGVPANSSVQFDFVLSFEVFKDMMNIKAPLAPQGPFSTYVELRGGTDVQRFNEKLSQLMTSTGNGSARQLFLKPYGDNYLYGNYENGAVSGGRIWYVRLFSLIAVFIVVIACINFINLSTAKASRRLKETGIRKSIGASRAALILQYLGESMLLTFVAMLAALLLVILLLPAFNHITGKSLSLQADIRLLFSFPLIAFVTGLLAGSYPAFYLSGFNPVTVLKGRLQSGTGGLWARRGLVIFQFTTSVVFIVAVIIVYRQLVYVQSRSLGYDKDHVICFDAEGKVPGNMDAFLSEVKKIPGVQQASSMVGTVLSAPSAGISWKDKTILFRPFPVNYDMIETLNIQMAAGRSFSRNYGADASGIILNEAALKEMQLEDPLGKVISFGGKNVTVTGIVKDFHFQSLHETVKPLFFMLEKGGGTVMVRISAGMEKQVISRLEDFYRRYNPGFTFDWTYLDSDYQAQYASEKKVAALAEYFAGLAVLISCLGLFGLAAYTAEHRRREIGIRKVLGATAGNIMLMLSGDLLKAVATAVCIGIPFSWWLMQQWLNGYAYHVQPGAEVFIAAALMMILITFFTVSVQAVKAATANPVKNLRSE